MAPLMIVWSIGVMFTCGAALVDLTTTLGTRSRVNSVSSGIALTLLLFGAVANICVLAGWL